jgi:hypothetical protein
LEETKKVVCQTIENDLYLNRLSLDVIFV